MAEVVVGCAGWAIPRAQQKHFPREGSVLERYARVFDGVEINSSFYRPHRPQTWERWAASVPPGFRFAVKLPKAITHELRLARCATPLARFLDQAGGLGDKFGPLLVQLPPSLAFDSHVVARFLAVLRARHQGPVVLEPRHASWFQAPAEQLLQTHRIARVAADPAVVTAAAKPGGWHGLRYFRWHGSPRMYWSAYTPAAIQRLAQEVTAARDPAWVVFDNTARGAATANALSLRRRLRAF